ncbi:lmo0937 family membrane protein [Metapseudomonas lalkuanensis]|nr:lmo0937 family membrane protein [Pseudomonas lalkuanensis]UCO96186.1 lmo0937 family membrane protein [Pseudomonas lalkuanensis]
MFETLVIVLLALWALGVVTSYYLGGLIHVLLFLAIALVVFRNRRGRRA